MAGSLWTKLKNAITGGPPPAHIHLHQKEPFYAGLWKTIRPPSRAKHRRPLSRAQTLLLRGAVSVTLLGATAWFSIGYFSTAEARSAQAVVDGMELLGPGDYAGAVGRFSEALAIWPGNAQAYLERGNAHDALGETAEALADWGRALDANPRLAAAYTARGTYYRVKGESEKALADLNRSLELEPSVDAYYQRGQVYHTLGRYENAIADFDLSIALLREAPYVYRARSAARRALGDAAGADADRDKADSIEQLR